MNTIALHSCPRSGSTWLQSIFEAHPNVKTVYQPLFSYAFKDRINTDSTVEDFNRFIHDITLTEDSFCKMKSNLHTNNGSTDIARFKKSDVRSVLMKHTSHNTLIDTFIKLDPTIKIIGLIRDPCSVIHSQMQAKHEKLEDWRYGKDKNRVSQYNSFGFEKWIEVKSAFHSIKERHPANIIIVKYEELVNDPIGQVKALCQFCGLDFHKNMEEAINIMRTKNYMYDYSVCKVGDTITKWKGKLDKGIVEYINNNKHANVVCGTIPSAVNIISKSRK